MSSISFGGLATGLDTGAIIDALMEIRRQPIVRLQARQTLYESQKEALGTLKTKLLALQTAAKDLDTFTEFASYSAASSREDILTATAGSMAAPGTYEIVVESLATAQKDISQGYASLDDVVGWGSLTVTVGGEATVVDIDPSADSLVDLKDAINAAGAGVVASILNDGSEGTPYRLILTAADTGAAAGFTIDLNGLAGGTPPTLTNVTAAANAALSIDSIPVTSPSNSISEAITGLNFDLHAADPDTSLTLTVASDDEAIQEKVQAFLNAYNDLFDFIQTQSVEGSPLRGNMTLRSVSSRISGLLAQPLAGEGDLTLLSQIGITVQRGGQLDFDAAKFQAAIAENPGAVRDLFIERGENLGKAYLFRVAIDDLTDSSEGIFKFSLDALTDRIDNMDDSIERYERGLDSYRSYLEQKFTAMESMVASLQAQGTYLAAQYLS
jgi:flagellar hook-associated protein 2